MTKNVAPAAQQQVRDVVQDHAVRMRIGKSVGIVHFAGETCRMPIGNGRFYHFENHHYFGPNRIHAKTGDPTKDNFSERSGFWPLYDRWVRGGKQVTDDGVCVLGPDRFVTRMRRRSSAEAKRGGK